MWLQINERTEFQVENIETDYIWIHNERAQHEKQKDKTERLQGIKQITCKRHKKRFFYKEQLRQEDSGVMLQNAEGKIST